MSVLKLSAPRIRKLEICATSGHFPLAKVLSVLKPCSGLSSVLLCGFPVSPRQLNSLISTLPGLSHMQLEIDSRKSRDVMSLLYCARAKSLKSVMFLDSSETELNSLRFSYAIDTILKSWSSFGYHPPEIGISSSRWLKSNFHTVSILTHSLPPSSLHKAKFCLYTSRAPLGLVPQYPVLEVHFGPSPQLFLVGCEPLDFPSISSFSVGGHCEQSKCYSSAYFHCNIVPKVSGSFATFSNSIQYLNLHNSSDLVSSEQLESIADICHNLAVLNLENCTSALKCLQGLSSVAAKCNSLTGLNIKQIHEDRVESTLLLWEVLSSVRKLTHLALSPCLMKPSESRDMPTLQSGSSNFRISHLPTVSRESVEQMQMKIKAMTSLLAFELEIMYGKTDRHCCCHSSSDRDVALLSNLKSVKHLRLVNLPPVTLNSGLTDVLGNLQQLSFLYISKCDPGKLTLPPNPSFYCSLKQLYLKSWNLVISDALVDALIHSGRLSHVYLMIGSISAVGIKNIIEKLPRLVACYISVFNPVGTSRSWKQFEKSMQSLAKSSGVSRCGLQANVGRQQVPNYYEGQLFHTDLVSLWM